jgi:hypothetical protein
MLLLVSVSAIRYVRVRIADGDLWDGGVNLEATARIELAIRVLQTPALPLGYVASLSDLIVPGLCVLREWSHALAAEVLRSSYYRRMPAGEDWVDGEPCDWQLPLRTAAGADACAADVRAALDAA